MGRDTHPPNFWKFLIPHSSFPKSFSYQESPKDLIRHTVPAEFKRELIWKRTWENSVQRASTLRNPCQKVVDTVRGEVNSSSGWEVGNK